MLPSWIINPLWDQFHALLHERIDSHPPGCHRPRVPDQGVFDKLLHVLVFGCGYERVADQACSARTPRRRRDEWIAAGIHDRLHQLALTATLDTLEAHGPLPEQPTLHLDAGDDYRPCRAELARRRMTGQIASRGVPAPIQAGRRWVVERSHAWLNGFGKLRWCTERRRVCVAFWLALACVVVIIGRLVRQVWTQYRWDTRPHRRP